MHLSRVQILAAAQALEYARGDERGGVESIVVDGHVIEDLAGLRARAGDIGDYQPSRVAQFIDGRAEWVAEKVQRPPKSKIGQRLQGFKERLLGTKVGTRLENFTDKDPERIQADKRVELRYCDGSSEKLDFPVTDVARSLALQRFSVGATLVSFAPGIPFSGILIPWAAAIVSLIGAGIALLGRERDTAIALKDTARKHAWLGLGHAAPVVGGAVSAMALLEDIKDIEELSPDEAKTLAQ